jgi:colicin import membrane protein
MPAESSTPTISLSERSGLSESQRDKLPKWLFLSLLFHGSLIASLFIVPFLPSRREYAPPVYTVDLVGGEKIGGNKIGTELQPPKPAPKEMAKNSAAEPAPLPPETKKEKEAKKEKAEKPEKAERARPVEKAVTVPEKAAPKETAKKEPAKKESATEASRDTKSEETSLDSVRERILQSAVERAKNRNESAQKAAKGDVISTGPGEGEGAAALGPGGRGGGVVKGMDFIIYQNRMFDTIKQNWAWIGQRSDVKVVVRFGIKESGEIVGLKVVQPSGDWSYDESVLRAVKKSSPLPPPPEPYRKDFADVQVTFRPKDLGA